MVDAERISARLDHLEGLLELLEPIHAAGEEAYLADIGTRGQAERWLQLAIQICIDVGAQLVSELSVAPPTDYAGIFYALAGGGYLDAELAERMAAAARQRNLLVHLYLDVDDREVFAALGHLDDLREFAAATQRLADEAES